MRPYVLRRSRSRDRSQVVDGCEAEGDSHCPEQTADLTRPLLHALEEHQGDGSRNYEDQGGPSSPPATVLEDQTEKAQEFHAQWRASHDGGEGQAHRKGTPHGDGRILKTIDGQEIKCLRLDEGARKIYGTTDVRLSHDEYAHLAQQRDRSTYSEQPVDSSPGDPRLSRDEKDHTSYVGRGHSKQGACVAEHPQLDDHSNSENKEVDGQHPDDRTRQSFVQNHPAKDEE